MASSLQWPPLLDGQLSVLTVHYFTLIFTSPSQSPAYNGKPQQLAVPTATMTSHLKENMYKLTHTVPYLFCFINSSVLKILVSTSLINFDTLGYILIFDKTLSV